MKYFTLLFLTVVAIAFDGIGQTQRDTLKTNAREVKLRKSGTQRTVAWIMLGGGILAIAAVSGGNQTFETTGEIAVLGVASILGSIPLFIAARRKRKAAHRMETSLRWKSLRQALCAGRLVSYPALVIKLKL